MPICFRDKRAVGLEYVSDAGRRDTTLRMEKKVAYASKLVVLSAGAFGSPAILERLVSFDIFCPSHTNSMYCEGPELVRRAYFRRTE